MFAASAIIWYEASYQIMTGWLITFEIARDVYICATWGQRSCLPRQILLSRLLGKEKVNSG